MIIPAHSRSVLLLFFVLLVAYVGPCADILAVGFSPFGTPEANDVPSAAGVEDEGPIIAPVQLNNSDITTVFLIISDASGWSIFPTEAVSKAKVTLYARDVTAKELLDMVVKLAGFVYHRQGDKISVMTYDEYTQYYGLVKKIVPLAYADASSVAAVVKQFMTKLGKVVVHQATNTIVLFEVDANFESISAILARLDTPAEDIGIETIQLKYANCESLAQMLQQAFTNKTKMARSRNSGVAGAVPEAPAGKGRITKREPVTAAKEAAVPYEEVGIYPVIHSNQLVVVGTSSEIQEVKDVVTMVDIYGESMVVEVIDLKYADAEMVARTLQQIFSQREPKESTMGAGKAGKSPFSRPSSPVPEPATGPSDILFTPQVRIDVYAIGRTNQLIARAFRGDLKRLKELVEKLDVFVEPTTRNYHFVFVDAAEVYQGLERILDIYSRYGGSSQMGGGQMGARGYGKESGPMLVERTNSILLTGPPSAHRIMESIRENVDVAGVYEAGMIKVYKIENGDVEEIAKTVQALIETRGEREKKPGEAEFGRPGEGAPGGGEPSATGPAPTGAEMAATEEFVPQIEGKVSVNKATNSVVVQATARQHRQLEQLIKELDVRRRQVLIEAMIVVIMTGDDLDFGVELGYFDGDLISFTSFGLSEIDPDTGVREIIVGPGGTAAVLEPDKLQALVRALESTDNVRIESAPRVLVNDNAVGLIQSVAEEPFREASQGQATTITAFGGFVEAGTQFAITPHISDQGYLRVEYQITLNAFAEKADPLLPPPRNTNTIQSEATVPDGSTIIVGGIQSSNESESVDKVPILGDIPLLGLLFRNTIVRKQYSTTYLFITTTVMKSEDFSDLRDASEEALGKVSEHGRDQGPGPETEWAE
ncbi:MAG: secretin N-terminal domain-containing protein [Planctomycetota bacterium]|jgi:type II secretory pathway component GspD/PulD (secretin)